MSAADDSCAQFMRVTGEQDEKKAMRILEVRSSEAVGEEPSAGTASVPSVRRVVWQAANWDVNSAVNIYLENGPAASADPGGSNQSMSDPVSLLDEGDDNEDIASSGIRAPLPSRRMQLQEGGAAVAAAAGADYRTPTLPSALCDFSRRRRNTSDDDNTPRVALDTLLGPPYDLLCDAPFEIARQTARDNKRLLIVNLQDDAEFASFALNRDVWKQEATVDLVKTVYVLWQQNKNTGEGARIANRYQVHHCPAILVLDSRTGELLSHMQVDPPVDPTKVFNFLYDASAEHSPQGGVTSAPAAKRPRTDAPRRESVPSVYYVPDSDEEAYSSDDIDNGAAEDDDELNDAELRIVRDTLHPPASGGASLSSSAAAAAREVNEASPSRHEAAAASGARGSSPSSRPRLTESDLPAQPDPGTPSSGRVMLRMPSGKRLVRRLMRSDPVSLLFAVASVHTGLTHSLAQRCVSKIESAADAVDDEFDLVMPSNAASLKDHPDETVADMGAVGASIVVQPRLAQETSA